MRVSTKFTAAIQFLLQFKIYENEIINAPFLAKKVGTDEVTMRQIMKLLKDNGIIASKMGPKGGTTLLKDLKDISVYDLFVIFESDKLSMTFYYSSREFPKEEIIQHDVVHDNLQKDFDQYLEAMKKTSIMDIFNDYTNRIN